MITFYGYDKCSTCRKARKFLKSKEVPFAFVDIIQTPPPKKHLALALKNGYALKDLFNTSGQVYRQNNIKDKLPGMSQADALAMLAQDGKLVKRPFVTDGQAVTIGFKDDVFSSTWT